MLGTTNCTYETPCGWCTKWDKKCDKKISDDNQSSRPRTRLGLYLDDMMPNLSTYISAYSNNSHIDTKEEKDGELK